VGQSPIVYISGATSYEIATAFQQEGMRIEIATTYQQGAFQESNISHNDNAMTSSRLFRVPSFIRPLR
jgi:hypothetical protein